VQLFRITEKLKEIFLYFFKFHFKPILHDIFMIKIVYLFMFNQKLNYTIMKKLALVLSLAMVIGVITANAQDKPAASKEKAKTEQTKKKAVKPAADKKKVVKPATDKKKVATEQTTKKAVKPAADKKKAATEPTQKKAVIPATDRKKAATDQAKAVDKGKAKAPQVQGNANKLSPDDKIIPGKNGPEGQPVYLGPRGGQYYINKNGNKTYLEKEK
jgi:colicin import membrane protein